MWENHYLIILSIHILKLEISGCDNLLTHIVYQFTRDPPTNGQKRPNLLNGQRKLTAFGWLCFQQYD
jgi:hypothetical protein